LAAVDLDALLRQALERLSVKEAVAEIAAVTGEPRREIYQRALALAKERDHGR
jgi:16S rRNA (cytidine1402-2'-O)-methyltransferase